MDDESYRGTLERVNSEHQNLRTDTVTGDFPALPEVGKCFHIFSEPLTVGADLRVVETTRIQALEQMAPGVWEFRTRNSIYRLRLAAPAGS